MKKIFNQFDDLFIKLINGKLSNRYFDIFMYRITYLGGVVFTTLFTMTLIFLGNTRIRFIGVELAVILGINQIIVYSLKHILGRERPYQILKDLNTYGINMKDHSFPSGHTTASFSIGTALALNIPRLAILTLGLAFIIGISRIYLAVHYPTDVLAGIFLGVCTSLVVHFYFLEYIQELATKLIN